MKISKVKQLIHKNWQQQDSSQSLKLSPEDQSLKQKYEDSFYEFVKGAWHVLEGNTPFIEGWHILILCDELEKASLFTYNRYIINIPPRHCKTLLLTMFTPWVWLHNPSMRFMVISGSKKLSLLDNMRCKMIIESEWFKKYWGDKVRLNKESRAKESFHIIGTGGRSAFGMGTNVRGHGANFILLDDPNTDMDIKSDSLREAKNDFIDSSVLTRFNDQGQSCLICVQQRLHEKDVTGHLKKKAQNNPTWKLREIIFPAIKEDNSEEISATGGNVSDEVLDLRKSGEAIFPQKWNLSYLDEKRRELGEYSFASQYQQRPAPKTGGIIKGDWFKRWIYRMPKLIQTFSSWDLAAMDTPDACYSACTNWGIFKDDKTGHRHMLLLSCWQGKLLYPDVKKMIERLWTDYTAIDPRFQMGKHPIDDVIIEKASIGEAMIPDLRREHPFMNIWPFVPKEYAVKSSGMSDASKIARASIASSLIEQGYVWLMCDPVENDHPLYKFSREFMEACIKFPRGDGTDYVDSMSQAILWAIKNRVVDFKGRILEEYHQSLEHLKPDKVSPL